MTSHAWIVATVVAVSAVAGAAVTKHGAPAAAQTPAAEWRGAGEPRVGLGCMRLSTERERDEARAIATVQAALDAGVTVFDTAHAYGRDDGERGHNEALLARALATHARGGAARVV